MIQTIFEELVKNSDFYGHLLLEHIGITFTAVIIATIVGLAIGIFIAQKQKLANSVISVVNITYTIPSIALLGFLISFTGVGNTTAIIALTIYALLPIVRSTYEGLPPLIRRLLRRAVPWGAQTDKFCGRYSCHWHFP